MFPPTGLAVVGVGIQSALPLGLSKNSDSEHRIRMKGFSYAAEFYHTDYSTHRPSPEQADYHRTLYWNPNLKLDGEGKAQMTFLQQWPHHPPQHRGHRPVARRNHSVEQYGVNFPPIPCPSRNKSVALQVNRHETQQKPAWI